MKTALLKIASVSASGFWRCGTHFPKSGKIVQPGDFSETQLQRLRDEPMLRVTAASDDDADLAEQRAAKIAEAIRSLSADDYQKDGKPKVDAINELIGDDIGKVTTVERNDVWAALLEDRFEAPSPPD